MSGRGSFFTGLVAGVLGIATACRGSDVPAGEAGTAAEAGADTLPLHSGPGDPGWPAHRLARGIHDWQQSGEDFALIDAGTPFLPPRAHASAVNVLMWIRAGGLLPPRDQRIVVYCSSETCPVAVRPSEALDQLGYEEIYDTHAGLQGWKDAGFPTVVSEFRRRFKLTALPGR